MSMYIENDDYNDSSNCNCSSTSNTTTAADENKERWAWLIDGWSTMTFKEKLGLFLPYLHYVNTRDSFKREFDDAFQKEMIETSYRTCRMFNKLKFDPDMQGIPNIIMVFDPIDIKAIPDATIKASVKAWGIQMGLIESGCCPCA